MDELGLVERPLHRGARRVARRRRHEAAGRPRRLGGAQSRLQHAAGQRPGRRARHARTRKVNVGDRHRRRELLGQPEHLRGDAAGLASPPRSRGPTRHSWLTTEEALRAATEGGARALGLDKQIGRIAPGYKADIVFLDLHHINWIPTNDPVNADRPHRGRQRRAFGDGRRPHGGREPQAADRRPAQARRPGRGVTRARREAPTGEAKKLYDRLEKVVGTFCPGLAKAPLHIHRYGASHHAPLRARSYAYGLPAAAS